MVLTKVSETIKEKARRLDFSKYENVDCDYAKIDQVSNEILDLLNSASKDDIFISDCTVKDILWSGNVDLYKAIKDIIGADRFMYKTNLVQFCLKFKQLNRIYLKNKDTNKAINFIMTEFIDKYHQYDKYIGRITLNGDWYTSVGAIDIFYENVDRCKYRISQVWAENDKANYIGFGRVFTIIDQYKKYYPKEQNDYYHKLGDLYYNANNIIDKIDIISVKQTSFGEDYPLLQSEAKMAIDGAINNWRLGDIKTICSKLDSDMTPIIQINSSYDDRILSMRNYILNRKITSDQTDDIRDLFKYVTVMNDCGKVLSYDDLLSIIEFFNKQ